MIVEAVMPIPVNPTAGWVYPTSPLARIAVPRVPNIGPGPSTVTITSPAAGAQLQGVVPIVFTTDRDSEAPTSYLAVDGVLYACLEGGGRGFRFDSTQLADGAHSLVVYSGIESAESFGRWASSAPVAVSSFNHPPYSAHFTAASAQALQCPNTAGLQGGHVDWSAVAWVWLDSKGSERFAVAKWDSGSLGNSEWALGYQALSDRFEIVVTDGSNAATALATSFGSPPLATWCFLAATYTAGTNTLALSVNAGSQNTVTFAAPRVGTTAFRIGGEVNQILMWDGRIDAVGFWKRALSTADITALYNGGAGQNFSQLSTPMKTSLIPYWDLEEAGAATYADSFGTNTLTNINGVTAAPGKV
jgi:hypothetical protein